MFIFLKGMNTGIFTINTYSYSCTTKMIDNIYLHQNKNMKIISCIAKKTHITFSEIDWKIIIPHFPMSFWFLILVLRIGMSFVFLKAIRLEARLLKDSTKSFFSPVADFYYFFIWFVIEIPYFS